MPKQNPELVDIQEFIDELDDVLEQIVAAKKQAMKAKRYAVKGKIPMVGMFSWSIAKSRIASLHNSFVTSWPMIRKNKA